MHNRTLIAAGLASLALAVVAPVSASAATNNATEPAPMVATSHYQCGYDGYQGNGQPFYNHCGRGDIVIQVDHFFWQTTYNCVRPGAHRIDQGNSSWAIIGAEFDGDTCSTPGVVVEP